MTEFGETGLVLPPPGEGQAPEIRIADHDREAVIGRYTWSRDVSITDTSLPASASRAA